MTIENKIIKSIRKIAPRTLIDQDRADTMRDQGFTTLRQGEKVHVILLGQEGYRTVRTTLHDDVEVRYRGEYKDLVNASVHFAPDSPEQRQLDERYESTQLADFSEGTWDQVLEKIDSRLEAEDYRSALRRALVDEFVAKEPEINEVYKPDDSVMIFARVRPKKKDNYHTTTVVRSGAVTTNLHEGMHRDERTNGTLGTKSDDETPFPQEPQVGKSSRGSITDQESGPNNTPNLPNGPKKSK